MNNPTFSRLSTYFWRYRWVFVACIVSMAISATTEPLFARLMKPLVDINFGERSQDELILVPIAIVGLVLLRSVSSYAYEYTSTWLAGRLVQDLRSEMFDHLLVLPNQFFDQNSSGSVVSKFIYYVSIVKDAGFNVITVSIKDSFTMICLLGLLIYYDWRLTIVCVLAIPFIAFSIRAARKRLRGLSSLGQDSMAEVAKILNEATQNQRIIKIFGGAEYEKQRFSERINVLRQWQVKQSSASAVNSGVVQMTIAIVLAIIVYYASFRAASGEMTAGDFVSYMTAMLMLFGPIKRLTGVNASLQKGLVAAESVFRFLDEPSEINAGQNRLTQAPSGAISFEQAHFRYPQ